ncbi:MAG: hypothetical protein AAFX58_05830 [Pseudomonadota bacterium]
MKPFLSVLAGLLLAGSAAAADLEAPSLEHFVGTWEGASADGRFREKTTYTWGPDRRYLDIDMAFFVNDQPTGTARGYFLIDEAGGGLVFHMLSSLGVAIEQRQIAGADDSIELGATAVNGARANMPERFRTRIHRHDADHYWTELLVHDGNDWQVVMQNEFERR